MRVILVDDHSMLLDALATALRPDVDVVSRCSTAEQALGAVEDTECDAVVLDLHLPGPREGLACLKSLKRRRAELPVLMLTMDSQRRRAWECMQAGAAGYVLKSGPLDELLEAIRQVSSGRLYLNGDLAEVLDSEPLVGQPRVTEREQEILNLLAQGLDARAVAERLTISVHTAKTHLRALYRKFAVSDRTQLVLAAWRARMIETTPA